MSKKGVSPLIATVLIIGFTIVLAAVVMQWGGSFVRSLTETTAKSTEAATKCLSVSMSLNPVDLSDDVVQTVDATGLLTVDGTLSIKATNNKESKISDLVVQVINPDGSSVTLAKNVATDTFDLDEYASDVFTSKLASGEKGITTSSKVKIIPKIRLDDGTDAGCSADTAMTVGVVE